jgi:hypothetical protein
MHHQLAARRAVRAEAKRGAALPRSPTSPASEPIGASTFYGIRSKTVSMPSSSSFKSALSVIAVLRVVRRLAPHLTAIDAPQRVVR